MSTQMAAQASPTNGPIYWAEMPRATKAVNPDGSTATVPASIRNLAVTPAFNLAGTKFAYRMSTMAGSEIKVADADGTNTITVASGSGLQTPQFSADGNTLYVLSSDGGGTSVVYGLDPTVANQSLTGKDIMTVSANIADFSVSSTGKIAYIVTTGCSGVGGTGYVAYIRDAGASGAGSVVPDSCRAQGASTDSIYPQAVEWNSDGTKLFIAQVTINRNTIVRYDSVIDEFTSSGRVSGTPFYSFSGSDKEFYGLSLSPDGTQLAFVVSTRGAGLPTPDGIYTLSLSTKTATKVATPTVAPGGVAWGPVAASAATTTTTTTTTTTVAPTTTAAPTTTVAATTTTVANVFAAAKPGITVTDSKVYTAPPAAVAADSAINVLTPAQAKVMDIQTKTPAVCLPNDDELVFIDEGKCIAEVVNAKTRAVLRTLKTSVVADDISEVKVGNAIVTLAPIYFDAMSSTLDAKDLARLRSIRSKVSAAGSVLIIGHAGTLNGNSPANVAISKARAAATLAALKSLGAKGPFAVSGVGALDPASRGRTEAAQAQNRRAVIVLIP